MIVLHIIIIKLGVVHIQYVATALASDKGFCDGNTCAAFVQESMARGSGLL